jgi:hypothetical protein
MRAILLGLLLSILPAQLLGQCVELQDALGDTGFSPTDQPAPDLRSGSIGLQPDGGLALRVRFAKGTFDPVATYVQFNLEIGQAVAGADECPRCGNYLVDINGVGRPSRKAKVQRRVGYEVAASLPIELMANGVDVVIPASVLSKSFAHVALRVVTCIRLRDDALSVILDRMSE